MKKIYYEKIGRKYFPISEYDSDVWASMPEGNHLVTVTFNGQSRKYNIDPEFAPMIAAGKYASDAISEAIIKATELRSIKAPITEGQRKAWKKLSKEFGSEMHLLQWPSAKEAADEAVLALQKEADVLLSNPAVRLAYDQFMLLCKLSKEIV